LTLSRFFDNLEPFLIEGISRGHHLLEISYRESRDSPVLLRLRNEIGNGSRFAGRNQVIEELGKGGMVKV